MSAWLRKFRKDRRSIIILFLVLEIIFVGGVLWMGVCIEKTSSPRLQVREIPWGEVLQFVTLAPERILWDQNEPISVTVWLHCIHDCTTTDTRTELATTASGEVITRTITTTLTITANELITHTLETRQNKAVIKQHEAITSTPISPLWIDWGNKFWVTRADGLKNSDWGPQVVISPTVNGPGEHLLVRRVLQPQEDPAYLEKRPNMGISLAIDLENDFAAFWRIFGKKIIGLGPILLTILNAAGGIWLDYLRRRDEQSREKLEMLQKLSQDKAGDIELLEAFIFHWQLVLPGSDDLKADYDQLRKKLFDPETLLSTLSAAYEQDYQSGENLLKKVVDLHSLYTSKASDESMPVDDNPLEKNLQSLSLIFDEAKRPLEKYPLLMEIWDKYQVPAYSFTVHKIREIWQKSDLCEAKKTFRDEVKHISRSQLYLSPVLDVIREQIPSRHWYEKVLPFQDVFFAPLDSVGDSTPIIRNEDRITTPNDYAQSELKRQKKLIEQLKWGKPFGNSRALAGQGPWLQNTWINPNNWETLVQQRDITTEQHLLCTAQKTWDVHAALCQYTNEWKKHEVMNNVFMVPLNFPPYWHEKDEERQFSRMVLTALAGGWAAFLCDQPVSFLNLTPPEQVSLLELGVWAAGSFAAWESWLVYKMRAHQIEHSQILRQLSRHISGLKDQVRLPSDQDAIPTQAQHWLTLRPVRLEKTYLFFCLPDPLTSGCKKPALDNGLKSILNQADYLAQQQIYLRGFVQNVYVKGETPGVTRLKLRWEVNHLLAFLEASISLFQKDAKPLKPIQYFCNLFKPHSSLSKGPPEATHPQADYRLAGFARGSLGRLVFAAQDLLQMLTENEDIVYLDETHLASLQRHDNDELTE